MTGIAYRMNTKICHMPMESGTAMELTRKLLCHGCMLLNTIHFQKDGLKIFDLTLKC